MIVKNIVESKKFLLSLSFIFFLVITLFLDPSQTIYAANITVNTFADELNTNGNCSLRESIQAANTDTGIDACTAGSGADTVILTIGTYTLSIAGSDENINATGDLDITDDLTINGTGSTNTVIDGNSIDRVIEIDPGTITQINGVTIKNGNSSGIFNQGTVTLNDNKISNNTRISFGGGILNFGTMTIQNSTIDNNETTGDNLSAGGGGIFSQGTMTITNSTVSNNVSQGRGGGIYNLDMTLTITNSTMSTNIGLNGGGIFNRFGTVHSTNTTLVNNTATDNGGGTWNFGGTATFANTIVAGNVATTSSDDCAGGKTSLGYNIASDASCGFSGTGDLNNTNPLLGPLTNNGGLTQTHALLSGSPAIDAVPFASCSVTVDQRGVLRPQGAGCDTGSFEHPATLPSQCSGNIHDYNVIQGTAGNDNLNGSSGKDLIFGYSGNDKLIGGAGNDCLIGGSGSDRLFGGSGSDVLHGGEDNDRLDGDSGDDTLFGSSGDDDMKGGSGTDMIDGQVGTNDKANGGSGTDMCDAEIKTSCEI